MNSSNSNNSDSNNDSSSNHNNNNNHNHNNNNESVKNESKTTRQEKHLTYRCVFKSFLNDSTDSACLSARGSAFQAYTYRYTRCQCLVNYTFCPTGLWF